ncbi:MAG: hypothetical protein NW200_07630 [Hyphomonadaceae bacterium]|nr:hypothetical protein [Hyphomonadaceae bacterium]
MSRAFVMMAAAAVMGLTTAPAMAAPLEQGRFAGSVSVGAEFPVDGDVHGGAIAPVASLAALNPNLPAAAAELRIGSRSFDDIYGEAAVVELEGAYGVGGDREVFGALRYVKADEGTVQVGTAFVPALSAELPVFGTFGDFESTSLEAGVRQYFGAGALRPYVAGRAGVAFVEEIRASFRVPVPAGVGAEPNDIALTNVPFYGDTTTVTAGFDVGVSYDVSDRLSLIAETGLRYQGDLDGDDAAIGGLGLGSINEEGSRIAAPVTVKLRYAF